MSGLCSTIVNITGIYIVTIIILIGVMYIAGYFTSGSAIGRPESIADNVFDLAFGLLLLLGVIAIPIAVPMLVASAVCLVAS